MVDLQPSVRQDIFTRGHISYPVELLPGLYQVVFQFPHRDAANVFLITGARPTLIDCGSLATVPLLVNNLSQLGVCVDELQIIATHGHMDHVQGLLGLLEFDPSLTMLIHPADLGAVIEGDQALTCSNVYRTIFQPLPHWACQPLVDKTIWSGDQELSVVHLPGHSPGHIGLLGSFGGVRTLILGDAIGGAFNPHPNSGMSLPDWRRSNDKILALLEQYEVEAFILSHESPGDLPKSRQWCQERIDRFGLMFNPWF